MMAVKGSLEIGKTEISPYRRREKIRALRRGKKEQMRDVSETVQGLGDPQLWRRDTFPKYEPSWERQKEASSDSF